MIYNQPTKADKIIPIVCLLIVLAFFAYLPAMINDKNRRLEQAWREKGCHMYDHYTQDTLPAKCANYFTDHYKPQQERTQPPEQPHE